jgi:putative hydrolase of the HAD superfamily
MTEKLRFLVCDLDNTLYPPDSGVMGAVGHRMVHYIVQRVGVPLEDADRLKRRYYHQYGTTMRGLVLHHGIDPEEYMAFVHDLPLEQFIQPNPELDTMLGSIPLRKVVFTNSDREHAERVLAVLGIRHRFERIIDIRDFNLLSKPHPGAYLRILDILKAHAGECILVEDATDNLPPAKALGMLTVLVGDNAPTGQPAQDGADIRIPGILDLAQAIHPWLSRCTELVDNG